MASPPEPSTHTYPQASPTGCCEVDTVAAVSDTAATHQAAALEEIAISTPTADWVTQEQLAVDPYPTYARLRRECPVAWVPSIGKYLITTHAVCHAVELDQQTYTAQVSGATMTRALGGKPMLRKDDPEHAAERRTINPTLRPKAVNEVWAPVFARNADKYLDVLADVGPTKADLNRDYAAPVAAQNLIDLLGMPDVTPEQMRCWSHAFIAGLGNLLDHADGWVEADNARAEVDDLLDELIPFYATHPNHSLTSALTQSGLTQEAVAANVKLIISGGMNEPQHMVTNMVWALDGHYDQKQRALADPSLWSTVFDECARWLSPVGMYPRETTRAVTLGGVSLPRGAPIGVVIASANRDETHFDGDPAAFDISRSKQPHLAFGSGVHLCAGHWAAKASIGQIAVPMLYERFRSLRVDDQRETAWAGWVFRGAIALPVTWED
ncbi:cytochrome P450 [Mycobacterium avium]|uniref:cytochrome P450 n=1 Tax=Mycobacterium avium TaxID=1764 RepID=UPI001CC39C16|nr:cytochrome P450 [Mycobacterium avium]MBZ4522648.1 cytochrome P450 [Mycobacterium avium subsp. hominissuis]MBZ4533068.1 cytochrome P450 [Mycobacterium avium subsp. hominissuis]